MNLASIRGNYDAYSGKASDAARQLAYAGVAVIWLFRTGEAGAVGVPDALIFPLAMFCFALGLDLLHYVVSALMWSVYNRIKEGQLGRDLKKQQADGTEEVPVEVAEFRAPYVINWPGNLFYWAKVLVVFAGHLYLIEYVLDLLRANG